jgi:hypothetical protein
MSTETRRIHLRDDDPVRVYADGAVRYWTGGVPGQGERLPKKLRTEAEAQVWAIGKRKELARRRGADPKVDSRLVEAFQEMLNTMTATGVPDSSIRQYKSNWNVWIAPVYKGSACTDADLPLWTKVFDEALKSVKPIEGETPRRTRSASKPTIKALERTLNTFISWGEERGYFLDEAPFGSAVRRRRVAKAAHKRARKPDSHEGLMDGVVLDFSEVEEVRHRLGRAVPRLRLQARPHGVFHRPPHRGVQRRPVPSSSHLEQDVSVRAGLCGLVGRGDLVEREALRDGRAQRDSLKG